MNKFLTAGIILLTWGAGLGAQEKAPDAQTIMEQVRSSKGVTSTQARIQMQLIPASGPVSERLIDQYSVEDKGLNKMMIIFQKPSSIQNTRFLTVEKSESDEDRWIFLPKLGKSRRIAAGQGGESFMESDFSYDDLSTANRSADKDLYTLLQTLEAGDETHYVVESRAKDLSSTQYSKAVYTVIDGKWIPLKIELYDKQGKLLKVSETLEHKKIDNVWTPTKIKMTNVQSGHATALTMEQLVYNKPIPAGVFTVKFLETGRQ